MPPYKKKRKAKEKQLQPADTKSYQQSKPYQDRRTPKTSQPLSARMSGLYKSTSALIKKEGRGAEEQTSKRMAALRQPSKKVCQERFKNGGQEDFNDITGGGIDWKKSRNESVNKSVKTVTRQTTVRIERPIPLKTASQKEEGKN